MASNKYQQQIMEATTVLMVESWVDESGVSIKRESFESDVICVASARFVGANGWDVSIESVGTLFVASTSAKTVASRIRDISSSIQATLLWADGCFASARSLNHHLQHPTAHGLSPRNAAVPQLLLSTARSLSISRHTDVAGWWMHGCSERQVIEGGSG